MLYLLTNSNYLCIEFSKTSMSNRFRANISTINIKSLLFLLLFVGSFISNNFYLHVHEIDGTIVYHSHPFASDAQHQHSGACAEIIQHLNHTNFNFDKQNIDLSANVILLYKLKSKSYIAKKLANYYSQLFNRPPPTLA